MIVGRTIPEKLLTDPKPARMPACKPVGVFLFGSSILSNSVPDNLDFRKCLTGRQSLSLIARRTNYSERLPIPFPGHPGLTA